MIVFECDLCGYTIMHKGIVRHHYDFASVPAKENKQRRFEQLIPSLVTEEVTDVCEVCFDKITAKQAELNAVQHKGIFDGVKAFIKRGLKNG